MGKSAAAKAAAHRLRTGRYQDHCTQTVFNFSWRRMNDNCELAGEYLKQNPKSDDDPATAEWLLSLDLNRWLINAMDPSEGEVRGAHGEPWACQSCFMRLRIKDGRIALTINNMPFDWSKMTKGELRAVWDAFKIPVKEKR